MSLASSFCGVTGDSDSFIKFSDASAKIAFCRQPGMSPCIVYLPGFRSSMKGRKGNFLLSYCQEMSLEYVCFDYRAFGESKGDWSTEASISNWLADTLWILDHVVQSRSTVLVGSSMGGWLALIATQRILDRIHGLVLLAPAVDMTRFYPDPKQRPHLVQYDKEGQRRKYYRVPNIYDDQEPYIIYEDFLHDGEQYCLLNGPVSIDPGDTPIRILHGEQDIDVPLERSRHLIHKLQSTSEMTNTSLRVIQKGDHRLSDPKHLDILRETLNEILPSPA